MTTVLLGVCGMISCSASKLEAKIDSNNTKLEAKRLMRVALGLMKNLISLKPGWKVQLCQS
jgi:hypothetical protein